MARGSAKLAGSDLVSQRAGDPTWIARNVQLLFQDPIASLSPRMTVGELLNEPFVVRGVEVRERSAVISELATRLGLPSDISARYPHQLSGGQARRVSLMRALAMKPRLLIADEPTAGLDLSVQGDVLNLIAELQRDLGLTCILISHNLNIIGRVTRDVAIMYLGRIVESGATRDLFTKPAHPYSAALLSASPVIRARKRRRRIILKGELPSPANPPPACRFHTRCPIVQDICRTNAPSLIEVAPGQFAACHFPFKLGFS